MNEAFLEVTFPQGRPFAAYLYLPHRLPAGRLTAASACLTPCCSRRRRTMISDGSPPDARGAAAERQVVRPTMEAGTSCPSTKTK